MDEQNHSPLPQTETASSDALGDMLQKLMAHPEVISYVASALGVNAPAATAEPDLPKEEPSVAASSESGTDLTASLAPLLKGVSSFTKSPPHSGKGDCRAELLCALKPYVNSRRSKAIDDMLRFLQITRLIQTLH
ncbi:MAG: hypothetical protein IJY42_06175 [Clostridia bacterium]|nr:hypothetical protein [Clostridia bacterium]